LTFYKSIGKKVLLSRNVLELKKNLIYIKGKYSIDKTITQELIPSDGCNKTISFTAFCDNGVIKTYWIGKKLREHPLRFGTATFCESIEQPELIDLSSRLLEKLKYTGVCEVEYLFDPRDNEFKLIEVNARTWLWVGLAKACGIDYAKIIYNFANGKPVIYPEKYEIGLKWINWFTDISYSILAILSGKTGILDYFGSLRGSKGKAIFNKSDIKPLFAFAGLSFTFFKSR
jgi:predicted ATP-grasp superfamily ATP-dependent carboligase